MIKMFVFIVTLYLPACAYSNELPYHISVGSTLSLLDDNEEETEALGYKAMLGYNMSKHLQLDFGYSDFYQEQENIAPFLVELSLLYPISEFASVYIGGGNAFMEKTFNPTAKLGIKYKIDRNWYADVGYQGIFDMDLKYDELYSFNVMIGYKFGQGDNNLQISPITAVEEEKEVKPEIVKNNTTGVDYEHCQVISSIYKVRKDDYLLKISRIYGLTIEELIHHNPKFYDRNINLIYPGELIVINHPKKLCH